MAFKIDEKTFERICEKHESCNDCPLLLGKVVEDDDTYDYHTRKICAKDMAQKVLNCMSALMLEASLQPNEYELDEQDWSGKNDIKTD